MAQERIFTFKGTAGEIHGSNQFGTSDESDESNELDGINKPDESVNPAGGWVQGKGFQIQWQDGPLGRGDERKEPNGASPEDVVTSVIQRMEFYQTSRLSCPENDPAITKLKEATQWINQRTQDRERRGVEGTNQK